MQKKDIPASVLARLPRYYRYARELFGNDVLRISSTELAAMMDVTASQIRQDLSHIGQFGQQGYGYNIKDLYSGLGEVLGLTDGFSVVIIGMSEQGAALAVSPMFTYRGIKLRGLFDYDASIGREINGLTVMPIFTLKDFCAENIIDIAVLCVPKEQAAEACAMAINASISAIWNLTGEELRPDRASENVIIQNLNLSDRFFALCASLNQAKEAVKKHEL